MKARITSLGSFLLSLAAVDGFSIPPTSTSTRHGQSTIISLTRIFSQSASSSDDEEECNLLDPTICGQFKILTCTSKSCAAKRQVFGMDEYATFGALYSRKEEAGASQVEVEESPCLGRCKLAPCVAVEHEDYVITVGLVGMTDAELKDRVFHKIITEEDCDRVWESVANGIQMMADEQNEEQRGATR